MGQRINRSAGMGKQESMLGFANMGEYFSSGTWEPRVQKFQRDLLNDDSDLLVFTITPKPEKKLVLKEGDEPKSSRAIWFLPATARLHEMSIFGHLNDILHKMPFSVCGLGHYDYGDKIARVGDANNDAICTDVRSWDTQVPLLDQCCELEFLQSLASSPEHADMMSRWYSIYGHKVIAARLRAIKSDNSDEIVLLRLRGQRGSGEAITYSMNSFLNAAIKMTQIFVATGSANIHAPDFFDALLNSMERGGSPISFTVSGDDDIVLARDFSKTEVTNDSRALLRYTLPIGGALMSSLANSNAAFYAAIGKERKDLTPSQNPEIRHTLAEVDFCSHTYRLVTRDNYSKWLAERPIIEIIGKACWMLEKCDSFATQAAWARTVSLGLLMRYSHLQEIRLLALAVLSSTDKNRVLAGLSNPTEKMLKPWLTIGTLEEALAKISKMFHCPLSEIPMVRRRCDFSNRGLAAYSAMRKDLPTLIMKIRGALTRQSFDPPEFENLFEDDPSHDSLFVSIFAKFAPRPITFQLTRIMAWPSRFDLH